MINEEIINRLAEAIGTPTSVIVEHYTLYFIAQSLAWWIFGAILIFVSIKYSFTNEHIGKGLSYTIKAAIFFSGLLFVVANIGTIVSPEAYAIHQLISDIRG